MNEAGVLKKIAKGGTIFSFGTFIATFIQFLVGIIVIRLLSKAEFGILSLALTTIAILIILATVGLNNGLPRLMAKFRSQGRHHDTGILAGTALLITICTGVLFAAILFLTAHFLAAAFLKPQLELVFKILALLVPAMVLTETFTAIFRGYEDARPKFIFPRAA